MAVPVYRHYDRDGATPAETLDVMPAAVPGAPLQVFIHGGYWHRMDNLAAAWRANGLATDIMDLAGEDQFTIAAQLADPRSALTSAILRQMALHGSLSS